MVYAYRTRHFVEQKRQGDRRDPSTPWEELQQKDDYRFLSGFVSEDLIFHPAAGLVLRTKEEYLRRKPSPAVWRFSSGSVRILDLGKDEQSGAVTSLLSTVVHTRENAGPGKSAVNLRSFDKGSSDSVCRQALLTCDHDAFSMAPSASILTKARTSWIPGPGKPRGLLVTFRHSDGVGTSS